MKHSDDIFGTHGLDGSDQTEMLHLDSLVHRLSRNEPHGIQARSRSMQQCPLDARISQIRSRARQISQPLTSKIRPAPDSVVAASA